MDMASVIFVDLNIAHCVYIKKVIKTLVSRAANVLPSGVCVGGGANNSELELFNFAQHL